LKIRNVKQQVLIGIAVIATLLINLPRLLSLLNVFEGAYAPFESITVLDIVVRILWLGLFSWFVLNFNTHWRFTKLPKSLQHFFGTLLGNLLVYVIFVFGLIISYEAIVGNALVKADKILLFVVYLIVGLIMLFTANIMRLQMVHRDDVLEKEVLKNQTIAMELQALKNQINPHFLFNSLNSLSAIVRANEQATDFVSNLSYMYRYILQSGERDMVTLSEELDFLNSYVHLIKTRYRDRFDCRITIDELFLNTQIPVLTLQLLVENAIKHNEISESHPLLVEVYTEEDELIVSNKMRARQSFVESTGQGLPNISKRFKMLKGAQIKIKDKEGQFIVRLPLKP
jgi:two-component system LytT family sensor kinase